MDVYIITGASKGIGLALSKQLMKAGHMIVCISRTKTEELDQLAKTEDAKLAIFQYDLANTSGLEQLMEDIHVCLPKTRQSITFINNAGVIEPIGQAEMNEPAAIEKVLPLI
ncbi:SDR family NAD(P)-dependent oxidoreductase [Bacillus sp. N9]